MIYTTSTNGINANQLNGFFVNWPNPPSPEVHLKLLNNSSHIVLAIEENSNQIVGYITAISDGVLSAYIPFLEVLPSHHGKGIGQQLVQRMFATLKDIYMIDLMCDLELQVYYEKFGMQSSNGMIKRNFTKQSGL